MDLVLLANLLFHRATFKSRRFSSDVFHLYPQLHPAITEPYPIQEETPTLGIFYPIGAHPLSPFEELPALVFFY